MSFFYGLSLKRQVIMIGLILAAGIVFALGMVSPHTEPLVFYEEFEIEAEAAELILPPEDIPEPTRAERIMRALVKAYPRRVLKVEYRNGDWAVLLRDTWFYYAEGRLLPGDLLYRIPQYRPLAFYDNYPREMPSWTPPTPEQVARFREWSGARAAQLPRAPHFFDTLYRARSFQESYTRVKTMRFLGNPVTVHHAIMEELALVERRILDLAETDTRVRAWVSNIDRVYGWHWRNVGGTQTRSFHAYGVAVDIMPRVSGGRPVYWRWAGPNWFNIPYERRYHPPNAVVEAFEAYGFVWGGKWSFFDTIHFEFRPEVIILSGIEMSTVR
ncbi:MAG: M15 family metallopeptidase [Treponema sp.]|nr:M15 family metallopeptidase [Treponema sp.]